MKKLILIILLFAGIKTYSQTEPIWYKDTTIQYKVDTVALWGDNDTSQAPNYLRAWYHYTSPDSIFQPQLILTDSAGNWLLTATDLVNNGWRSRGTVKEFKLTPTQMGWTPEQLRDSLILPDIKTVWGSGNVTK